MTENNIIGKIIDAVYPPACPICGKAPDIEAGVRRRVCADCERKLTYIGEHRCMKCGKELEDSDRQYCYDCSRTKHIYTQGIAVFAYTEGIKQSIYRYKYKGRREYAVWYGEQAVKKCKAQIAVWNPDVIIPIPLHANKLKKRGYNQAELFAVEIGRNTGIPVNSDYLVRERNTAPMKALSENERIKNLEKAFIIKNNGVKYNKVMLADDIYTTGATVDACAKRLKEAGIEQIYCVSLCAGRGI